MPDTAPLVFLDTETTGLHPDRRPWEIAIIRRDRHGEREITIQVLGVDLANAELIGLNIGRFYDRHVDYAPRDISQRFSVAINTREMPEQSAAIKVEQWTRGAHIVGAVPNFDTECLAAMLRRHKLAPSWHYHLVDVENLAVGHLCGMLTDELSDASFREKTRALIAPPWRSDDLSRACGVEPPGDDERHTAMGDARWAMRLYDAIMTAGDGND